MNPLHDDAQKTPDSPHRKIRDFRAEIASLNRAINEQLDWRTKFTVETNDFEDDERSA